MAKYHFGKNSRSSKASTTLNLETHTSPLIANWHWMIFATTVILLLAIDLWTNRKPLPVSHGKTLASCFIWIAAGLAFGLLILYGLGETSAQEYYGAYAMEEGLSLDNIFMFFVIFQSLGVQPRFQHKVLFWGVLGAVIFRGLFIFFGLTAVNHWAWVNYVFGGILLFAAWRTFRQDSTKQDQIKIVEWLSHRLPIQNDVENGRFTVKHGGRKATPLLLAVIGIEFTDVLFAVDSIPATFSITHDRFIVCSSNMFAILGLRALYLFLFNKIAGMKYLHFGLASVLVFAALKIFLREWLAIPPLLSIGVIVVLIGGAVWASLRARDVDSQI